MTVGAQSSWVARAGTRASRASWASRLTNRYHVPALLFSIEDGIARGSGRSVGKVNLFDAVERCSDLLIRRGGMPGAVGVTIEASKLDEFRRRLSAVLSELPAEDFEDTDEVAAIVDLSELNIETIEQISRLEPFGQGNKVPLLAAEGVTMCDRAVVGKTGEHMALCGDRWRRECAGHYVPRAADR